MISSEGLAKLSQERDKYSMLTYLLTKAVKNVLDGNIPKEDSSPGSPEEIKKYLEQVLKENNLLYK